MDSDPQVIITDMPVHDPPTPLEDLKLNEMNKYISLGPAVIASAAPDGFEEIGKQQVISTFQSSKPGVRVTVERRKSGSAEAYQWGNGNLVSVPVDSEDLPPK